MSARRTPPKKKPRQNKTRASRTAPTRILRIWRWFRRGLLAIPVLLLIWVALLSVVTPPPTPYMIAEQVRLHRKVEQTWVSLDQVAPVMARSVVAAEDANFCLHWGFDIAALRNAIEQGGKRGASTISQQVAKNVFLWQGRSYVRKALEAVLTPAVELLWSKRRIIEVYLNVAEFAEGVFGVSAAARHYFGVTPEKLSPSQAATLAAILPNPKVRSASKPGAFTRRRAAAIADGAATIAADGRDKCFAD